MAIMMIMTLTCAITEFDTDFNYNYGDVGLTIGLTIGATVGGLLLPCIILAFALCVILTTCVCNKNCPLYEPTHRHQRRQLPVRVITPNTNIIGMIILLLRHQTWWTYM